MERFVLEWAGKAGEEPDLEAIHFYVKFEQRLYLGGSFGLMRLFFLVVVRDRATVKRVFSRWWTISNFAETSILSFRVLIPSSSSLSIEA
ncbi:hypothetical protein AL755_13570 [Arthrobacter sp. ERGS1:01]|nr:hypothetical protein AL755_13570 [Arthrobacter sp. ERGS1:01]